MVADALSYVVVEGESVLAIFPRKLLLYLVGEERERVRADVLTPLPNSPFAVGYTIVYP